MREHCSQLTNESVLFIESLCDTLVTKGVLCPPRLVRFPEKSMTFLNFGRTSHIRTGDLYHVNIGGCTNVHSSPHRLNSEHLQSPLPQAIETCKHLRFAAADINLLRPRFSIIAAHRRTWAADNQVWILSALLDPVSA